MALAMIYLGARVLDANANAGIGIIIRRASEIAESKMQELQEQLKVLTDTELIEEAGLPTLLDPLSGQEGCRSVESKDRHVRSDMHLTKGFPLLFDGTDNPKAQMPKSARCRFCFKSGVPHVIRCLGPHHETSCKRHVANAADRSGKIKRLEQLILYSQQNLCKARDFIVVDKQHVEGSSYQSGLIKNGDEIVCVSSNYVGSNIQMTAELLRGDVNTEVTIEVARRRSTREGEDTGQNTGIQDMDMYGPRGESEVKRLALRRGVIWGHSAPAGIFHSERNYETVPQGTRC